MKDERAVGVSIGDSFAVSETGEHANGYTELEQKCSRNAVMVDTIVIQADIQNVPRALR